MACLGPTRLAWTHWRRCTRARSFSWPPLLRLTRPRHCLPGHGGLCFGATAAAKAPIATTRCPGRWAHAAARLTACLVLQPIHSGMLSSQWRRRLLGATRQGHPLLLIPWRWGGGTARRRSRWILRWMTLSAFSLRPTLPARPGCSAGRREAGGRSARGRRPQRRRRNSRSSRPSLLPVLRRQRRLRRRLPTGATAPELWVLASSRRLPSSVASAS